MGKLGYKIEILKPVRKAKTESQVRMSKLRWKMREMLGKASRRIKGE